MEASVVRYGLLRWDKGSWEELRLFRGLHCHFIPDLFPIFPKLPETVPKHQLTKFSKQGRKRVHRGNWIFKTLLSVIRSSALEFFWNSSLKGPRMLGEACKDGEIFVSVAVSTGSHPNITIGLHQGAPTLTLTTKIKLTLTMTGQILNSLQSMFQLNVYLVETEQKTVWNVADLPENLSAGPSAVVLQTQLKWGENEICRQCNSKKKVRGLVSPTIKIVRERSCHRFEI